MVKDCEAWERFYTSGIVNAVINNTTADVFNVSDGLYVVTVGGERVLLMLNRKEISLNIEGKVYNMSNTWFDKGHEGGNVDLIPRKSLVDVNTVLSPAPRNAFQGNGNNVEENHYAKFTVGEIKFKVTVDEEKDLVEIEGQISGLGMIITYVYEVKGISVKDVCSNVRNTLSNENTMARYKSRDEIVDFIPGKEPEISAVLDLVPRVAPGVKTPEDKKIERKECLKEKFKYAAKQFGKVGTRSDHPEIPKEQQLSIDLGNKPVFGIISKILHWIENKFKYLFPRYNLFPEVGNEDRKIPGTKSQVKYFDSEEQNDHALHYEKNDDEFKLYNAKGELYDTKGEISKGQKGCVAYVITLDGRLITHAHVNVGESEYAYRHSTLAGGEPVICSGLMKIKGGKIVYIDNNSGHYKPRSANLYNAIKKFKDVFHTNAKVVHFGNWHGFFKEIPILCRIISGKKESIDRFLNKMEKKGKSGLTKVEERFKEIREYNRQYEQKVLLGNYKSLISKIPGKSTNHEKHHHKFLVEHAIRKMIEAECGHKPKIELVKEEVDTSKKVGMNITFHYKDDYENFVKLLQDVGYSDKFTTQEREFNISDEKINAKEYIVFMREKFANQFIKNTLQINKFTSTVLSDLQPLPERSYRR